MVRENEYTISLLYQQALKFICIYVSNTIYVHDHANDLIIVSHRLRLSFSWHSMAQELLLLNSKNIEQLQKMIICCDAGDGHYCAMVWLWVCYYLYLTKKQHTRLLEKLILHSWASVQACQLCWNPPQLTHNPASSIQISIIDVPNHFKVHSIAKKIPQCFINNNSVHKHILFSNNNQ